MPTARSRPRVRLLGSDSRLRVEIIPQPASRYLWDRIRRWFAAPPKAYTLLQELAVQIDGKRYAVPKGTRIDGFTVPRGFRWIIQPMGPNAAAAAVHDDMYNRAHESKAFADAVFYELLKLLGCPRWAAWLAYKAVKIGGEGNYPDES